MKNLRVTTAVGAIRSGLSVLLLALVCAQCKPGTGDKPLRSPDGRIAVAVFVEDGVPLYRVERDGKAVLAASALGLRFRSALALDQDLAIVSTENRSFDETWVQPWGEQRLVRNRYNERRVRLRRTAGPSTEVDIVFRVFDDGVGFRYEVPDQSGFSTFELMDEHTEFNLADDLEAWWIPAYWWNRYEYLYQYTPVSQIDTVHTPLTLGKTGGPYLAIHEAALTDFASMTLVATGGTTLEADLVPWSDGVRVRGAAPLLSPWRTIQMSDTPGGLIESMLVLNLNEPNRIEDTSWIQPGKYVGIWWGMHIGKYTWASGPQHGATTANAKRHMDFAARHGFNGVLVEGWNLGWDGDWTANGALFDFTTPYPDFDIEEVTRYGAELGVELIGHHETGAGVENYERQLEDAFAYYRNLGVRTVKTGYVGWGQNILRTDEHGDEHREWHHGQYMVRHYRKVVETAARYGIMLDVHEPIKDTGIRRTYPNMMTREGARGQEYNAGWAEGGNPPEHETVVAFTRSLAGPFDFTPGIFRHRFPEYRPESGVPTTLARQLAQYVVIYSPLQMAADLPENYEGQPALKFIEDVPVDWDTTIAVNGEIGAYVTIARKDRHSADWYLGSVTDEEERVLDIPFSFLDESFEYVAEIYRDGPAASWQENNEVLVMETRLVEAGTSYRVQLAPGGGLAIRFRPAGEDERATMERLP